MIHVSLRWCEALQHLRQQLDADFSAETILPQEIRCGFQVSINIPRTPGVQPPFFIGWFPSFTIILVGRNIIFQKGYHHFLKWWQRLPWHRYSKQNKSCIVGFLFARLRRIFLDGLWHQFKTPASNVFPHDPMYIYIYTYIYILGCSPGC